LFTQVGRGEPKPEKRRGQFGPTWRRGGKKVTRFYFPKNEKKETTRKKMDVWKEVDGKRCSGQITGGATNVASVDRKKGFRGGGGGKSPKKKQAVQKGVG